MGKLKHEEMKWICLLDDYSFTAFASHLTAHVLGQSLIIQRTVQMEAKPKKQGILWYLISFDLFLFPRPLACTRGQRNTPSFVTGLTDSAGVYNPWGTHWLHWTMTPPKYWPNSMSQPWLRMGKMNALFDDCHHWKWQRVSDSRNKRTRKNHLVMQALRHQFPEAAIISLFKWVFLHFPTKSDIISKGLHN